MVKNSPSDIVRRNRWREFRAPRHLVQGHPGRLCLNAPLINYSMNKLAPQSAMQVVIFVLACFPSSIHVATKCS